MYYGNRQGGSAATFIIVGLLLTALAAGVLYGARQYMASQRIAPISEESMQTSSTDDEADDGGTSDATDNSEADTAANNTQETQQEAASDTITDDTDSTTAQQDTEVTQDAPLPQTGPASTALGALVLGFAAASTVAYLRSQRLV